MEARMKIPGTIFGDAMTGIGLLYKAMHQGGVDERTLELVHMRASQINGCSACVDAGLRSARKSGETDERLVMLTAWRETNAFTDAERAALALTEAATRLADRSDGVSDEVWQAATKYFDEEGMSAIVLMIAVTNMFNRINATLREPAGATWGS